MAEALAATLSQNGTQPVQVNGQAMYQASPTYAIHQGIPFSGGAIWSPGHSFAQTPGAPPMTPTCTSPNINTDMLTKIMSKLDSLDTKLAQLDSIQHNVSKLNGRLDTIDQKISDMESKIRDIERSRDFDTQSVSDLSKQQRELDSLINKMKKYEQDHQQNESSLKDEIQDLKCRSMRDNLLFHRLPEEKDENCEQIVLKAIEEKLKIANATTDIRIQRAHRIGEYNTAKTRPIVVKFAFYPDRERVRQAARQVKDSSIGVSEQFPKEVMETRRKLIPIMLKAREEGKDAYIRVDKLFINKRLYRGGD